MTARGRWGGLCGPSPTLGRKSDCSITRDGHGCCWRWCSCLCRRWWRRYSRCTSRGPSTSSCVKSVQPAVFPRVREQSPGQGLDVVEGVALVPGHAAEPQHLHPRAAVERPVHHLEGAAEAAPAVGARDAGGAPRESVETAA